MKKFILPAMVVVFAGLLVYFGAQIYSATNLNQVLLEEGITWESEEGGSFVTGKGGVISGQLPTADGKEVEFDLRYAEQFGQGFRSGEDKDPIFSAGLRLRGLNVVFLIEEDHVGLAADKFTFRRVG